MVSWYWWDVNIVIHWLTYTTVPVFLEFNAVSEMYVLHVHVWCDVCMYVCMCAGMWILMCMHVHNLYYRLIYYNTNTQLQCMRTGYNNYVVDWCAHADKALLFTMIFHSSINPVCLTIMLFYYRYITKNVNYHCKTCL